MTARLAAAYGATFAATAVLGFAIGRAIFGA